MYVAKKLRLGTTLFKKLPNVNNRPNGHPVTDAGGRRSVCQEAGRNSSHRCQRQHLHDARRNQVADPAEHTQIKMSMLTFLCI
jgi:hypothetical protein